MAENWCFIQRINPLFVKQNEIFLQYEIFVPNIFCKIFRDNFLKAYLEIFEKFYQDFIENFFQFFFRFFPIFCKIFHESLFFKKIKIFFDFF